MYHIFFIHECPFLTFDGLILFVAHSWECSRCSVNICWWEWYCCTVGKGDGSGQLAPLPTPAPPLLNLHPTILSPAHPKPCAPFPWTCTLLSFHQLPPLAFGSPFTLNSLPGSFLVNLSHSHRSTYFCLDEHSRQAQTCLPCHSWGTLSQPQKPHPQPPTACVTHCELFRAYKLRSVND